MALKIGNVSRIQLFLGRGDLPATGFGALLPAGYNLKSVGNTVNIRFLVSIWAYKTKGCKTYPVHVGLLEFTKACHKCGVPDRTKE
jgi:hypothetical protein